MPINNIQYRAEIGLFNNSFQRVLFQLTPCLVIINHSSFCKTALETGKLVFQEFCPSLCHLLTFLTLFRKHTPFKSKLSKHSNAKYSQPLSKFYRPGFINKGNTSLLHECIVTNFECSNWFLVYSSCSGIRRAGYFTSCCCILPNNVFS